MESEPRGEMNAWQAALAVGLAGLGVGVSLVGASRGSLWLEHRVGPALTLAGAVLWVVMRWRSRGR